MRYVRFLLPILLVLIVDQLLRIGAWEPFAQPDSHAGTSIRLKHALNDKFIAPAIQFVTLGSSRPHYGLRHSTIDEHARKHGFRHANLAMPGTHWITVGVMSEWLSRHRSDVRGGIIALSIQDFSYFNNGTYEIGIVEPFQNPLQPNIAIEHLPPSRENIASWGTFSGLVAWREDIRNAALNPAHRFNTLRHLAYDNQQRLFGNVEDRRDMCDVAIRSAADCRELRTDHYLSRQCSQILAATAGRTDLREQMKSTPLPEHLDKTKILIQKRLLDLRWQRPIPVLLMPMHHIWQAEALPDGIREWTQHVLQPLIDDGTVVVLDYTDFFNHQGISDCSVFFDFYHNNVKGAELLTNEILENMDQLLYQ